LFQEFIVAAALPDGQAVFGVVPFVETYQMRWVHYFQSADGSSSDDVNQHRHRHSYQLVLPKSVVSPA